jgi:mono/diheme cytochrome c family protein
MRLKLLGLICFLCLTSGLILTGEVESCPVVTARTVYHAPVVEVPAVVLTPVPVAITVPQYSVGYDYQSQSLQLELQRLRLELAQLRAGGAYVNPAAPAPALPNKATPPLPPPTPEAAPQQTGGLSRSARGQQVLGLRCASCHDKTRAAEKAKGHALFDAGKLLEPDKNAGLMLERIDLPLSDPRHMPPGVALTDREFADVTWRLTVSEEAPK